MDNNISNAVSSQNERPSVKHGNGHKKTKSSKKRSFKKFGIALLIVLILSAVTFGVLFCFRLKMSSANIDESKYQAIFLSNGQVYFGKLDDISKENYKLKDIFYLQTNEKKVESTNPQETTSSEADVQLIKLGSEIHGPEDQMIINKDQVLFFENINNEGKVARSIHEYKNK